MHKNSDIYSGLQNKHAGYCYFKGLLMQVNAESFYKEILISGDEHKLKYTFF